MNKEKETNKEHINILINKLKQLESNDEINNYIIENKFDSDSEDFYNNATEHLHILVNEIVFLLDNILNISDNVNAVDILNQNNYNVTFGNEEGVLSTISTNKALILF